MSDTTHAKDSASISPLGPDGNAWSGRTPVSEDAGAAPRAEVNDVIQHRLREIESHVAHVMQRGTWNDWRVGNLVVYQVPWLITELASARARLSAVEAERDAATDYQADWTCTAMRRGHPTTWACNTPNAWDTTSCAACGDDRPRASSGPGSAK